MKRLSIFVCCHKKDFFYNQHPFVPIQVGKALSSVELEMAGDDTGTNISKKNRSYCELTALYWIWKNYQDSEYIGLCHYRRYFGYCLRKSGTTNYTLDLSKVHLLSEENILTILKSYDIILPDKAYLETSVKNAYCISHSRADYEILKEAVKIISPEYYNDFVYVMEKSNIYTPYNMFISNRTIMAKYCEWLFSILEYVENHVDISNYDAYQSRIFGFMSERLLQVFCSHNKLKVKYSPVVCLMEQKNKGLIHNFIYKTRTTLSFKLQRTKI